MRCIEWHMVTLPMTLSAPIHPKPPRFLHFTPPFKLRNGCTYRDFKFVIQVNHSKSHPADEKSSLKGAWSGSRSRFRILHPAKYLRNG